MSKVGRYSKVSRRKWGDERVCRLSFPKANGFTVWDRLLTGPELSNVPGLFAARESGLAEALGWELKAFRDAFSEVSREGLAEADWKVGLVWVPNAIRHNEPESPNVILSWENTLAELPDCALKTKAFGELEAWAKSKGESWYKALAKSMPKSSGKAMANQEQEQEQEQEQKQEKKEPAAKAPAKKPIKAMPPKSAMSSGWVPSDERLDAICEKLSVSRQELLRHVPEFRLYWMPGGKGCVGPKAQKRPHGWDQAFSFRVDQLVEWGKIEVGKPGSAVPDAPSRSAQSLGLPGF